MLIIEDRASTILYKYLKGVSSDGVYLLPANICPIVPITYLKAGKSFEFIDLDELTLCMSEPKVLAKLSEQGKYSGVHFAPNLGYPYDSTLLFSKIKAIDPEYQIIDDRCLCIPSFDYPVDTNAALTLFSTGYPKYVDIGVGGFGFIRDYYMADAPIATFQPDALAQLVIQINETASRHELFVYVDSAWLGSNCLVPDLDDYRERVEKQTFLMNDHKRMLNDLYASRLPKEVQMPEAFQNWRFNIRVQDKQRVLGEIFSGGLFASSHYASLSGTFFPGEEAPVAVSQHDHIINLFNDFRYNISKAERTVELIKKHLLE